MRSILSENVESDLTISSISRALISDVWDADMRGKALAIFAVAPFAGPALGPTVAGFIGDNSSWRNLFWVVAAFVSSSTFCTSCLAEVNHGAQTGFCFLVIVFTVPETYA